MILKCSHVSSRCSQFSPKYMYSQYAHITTHILCWTVRVVNVFWFTSPRPLLLQDFVTHLSDRYLDYFMSLQWHHNGWDGVSNHQPHDCLLNHLFRHRSKKTSKLHVIGLCTGNSPGTGEFPAQRSSNSENVSIWWCHHVELTPGECHWTSLMMRQDWFR